jgi:hypothetical protein
MRPAACQVAELKRRREDGEPAQPYFLKSSLTWIFLT